MSREVGLAGAVGSSIGELIRTDVSRLAFDPAANASVESDKLTPVTPDQSSRSGSTTRSTGTCGLQRSSRAGPGAAALALAFGAIGTFLAAIGLQLYVALTTAIVGACITIVESRQLGTP